MCHTTASIIYNLEEGALLTYLYVPVFDQKLRHHIFLARFLVALKTYIRIRIYLTPQSKQIQTNPENKKPIMVFWNWSVTMGAALEGLGLTRRTGLVPEYLIGYLLDVLLGLWYVVLGKWQRKVIDVTTEAWLWRIGKRTFFVLSPARDQLTAANCMLWFNQLICGVTVKPHISWGKGLPIVLRSQEIRAARHNARESGIWDSKLVGRTLWLAGCVTMPRQLDYVWNYFEKVAQIGRAKCKICSKEIQGIVARMKWHVDICSLQLEQDVEANTPEKMTDEMTRPVAIPSSNPMQSPMRKRLRRGKKN